MLAKDCFVERAEHHSKIVVHYGVHCKNANFHPYPGKKILFNNDNNKYERDSFRNAAHEYIVHCLCVCIIDEVNRLSTKITKKKIYEKN